LPSGAWKNENGKADAQRAKRAITEDLASTGLAFLEEAEHHFVGFCRATVAARCMSPVTLAQWPATILCPRPKPR